MRQFGDKYVRFEFDQHNKNQATLEQYRQFYQSWLEYNKSFEKMKPGTTFGKSLSEDELKMLSEEQKESLKKLEDRTK